MKHKLINLVGAGVIATGLALTTGIGTAHAASNPVSIAPLPSPAPAAKTGISPLPSPMPVQAVKLRAYPNPEWAPTRGVAYPDPSWLVAYPNPEWMPTGR